MQALKNRGGAVKAHVYAMLAQGGMTHAEIAQEVRRRVPSAETTARSVASMAVDMRKAGGVVAPSGRKTGEVKAIVYRMLAKDRFTHGRIAQVVRRCVPDASTTHKSVASMAVDWRRSL